METVIKLWEAIILVSFRGAYCVVHRVCFSNVYLYSTLTTNSASISNYNHDVNLFLVMAYWLPSFIPSSIIFWRLLLGIWWCEFSSQSGHQIQKDSALVHKNQVKHGGCPWWYRTLFPTCTCFLCGRAQKISMFFLSDLLCSICRFIASPEMAWNVIFRQDVANYWDKWQRTLTAENSKRQVSYKTLQINHAVRTFHVA